MQPLRILQISYDMNLGGAETLVMNIYRNIDRSKVQFDFLLHSPERSAYEDEIEALGGRIHRIPRFLGYNRIPYDKALGGFLKAHPEYTIIHDHLMDSASETFRVAKRLGRTTIAHSHIADVPKSLGEFIRGFFRKDLWRRSDYRFACSEAAGLWLYRGKADFTVLRNGIETDRYRFDQATRARVRQAFNAAGATRLYGTIGRLEPQKNQSRLLDIFKAVLDRAPDSILVLIGTGSLEAELKGKAKTLGIDGKVIFTGPRRDVNDILMGLDAFILPSLYEGLGIVLVEAQASGLPCIYTDTIPQDVDLVPALLNRTSLEESDGAWAERIINAHSEATERDIYFREVAEKGYDIRATAAQLQDFYLNLQRLNQ